MKIRVHRGDGNIETITLKLPAMIAEGSMLDRITDSTGMEHFFTKDGIYDGWGRAVSCDMSTAIGMIEETEARRDVDDSSNAS